MKKSIPLILFFYIIVLFNGYEKENNDTNNITGVGSIYDKGSPTINSTITGLGTLVDDND